jgi:magnesium transporter
VEGHLLTADSGLAPASVKAVTDLLAKGTFFWLDLESLDQEGMDLLTGAFKFHPLALEDVEHFGQRPKIDDYDGYLFIVAYGAQAAEGGTGVPGMLEVHCFYSSTFLVTVHRGPCSDLGLVAQRIADRKGTAANPLLVLHRVVDALVDGFFPILAAMDDRIDELEDGILSRPTDEQLGALFGMKRGLVQMRKVVTPERDMFGVMLSGGYEVPGMDADSERYFRDVYDHLIRISDLVDSYRDLLTGAMDTYLSTVSNRLNAVMKQLTIIATIFLPLSFLTGFFGQNFSWLVSHIQGLPIFIGVGIGLEVLAVVALLVLFLGRHWL